MATKKISELEEINQAENDDYLVVVDTSESKNKKITKENFLKISALEEKISDLENNQLTASTEGTSIDINDSADYQVREMIPNGNTTQNGTPTPTNPVLIKNAGDAKNLYYLPEAGSSDGITYSINEDETINLSGTATANVTFPIFKTIAEANIENGSTYTFSSNQALPSGVEFRAEAFNNTSWLRHLIGSVLNNSNRVFTGTANLTDATRIRHLIYIASGTTVNLSNLEIQFEKGSVKTSFTPEGKGFINEVISNKNSLPAINRSYTSYELTTDWEGNTAIINGTCTQTWSDFMGTSLIPIYLTAGKYTISASDYTYNYTFRFQLKDGTLKSTNIVGGSSTIEFTQDVVAYRYWIYRSDLSSVTFSNYKVSFQIEKGLSATSFVEHQEQNILIPCQEPMKSIGDIRDSFVKQDGVWYEKHNIGQVVLNGSESGWAERGNTSENYIKFRNANALPYDIKGDLLLISDYFVTNIGANNASYSGNAICGNSGNYAKWLHISIDNTIVNSVETFKTWLSTHNTEVIYQLAEPIYLECTEEQITALEQARTYKPVTHISSADVVPAYLGVTYVRDLETVINNLS